MMSRPRVVVAGQVPPPVNGQNLMIARIVAEFARAPELQSEHLVFRFTPDARQMRRGSVRKLLELARVIARLLAIRSRGPIDLLLFPSGGPQNTPMLRDLLLLPWILLCSRRVVVQFHAAGIADRLERNPSLLGSLVATLYGRCDAALVMTEYNRRDPEALGIPVIDVAALKITDEFDAECVRHASDGLRLLYVGHLCPEKGTPDLLRAFAQVAARHRDVTLELAGEPLPPLDEAGIRESIRELGITDRVEWRGVLTGRAKQDAFGRADIFVFPTIAPFESFGLVMAEAMMWGLPVVATDWRGNRQVLRPDFDGVCHPVAPDLSTEIAAALELALTNRRADPTWGARNRAIFLEHYCYDAAANDSARNAARWLALPV